MGVPPSAAIARRCVAKGNPASYRAPTGASPTERRPAAGWFRAAFEQKVVTLTDGP